VAAPRPPGWRIGLDCALALAGLAVAVWRLAPTLAGVSDLGARVASLRWSWLIAAVVLGTASLVLYGVLHRRLLMAGGAWLPARTVQAITFIQNAFTQSLPSAGSIASTAYAATAFRRRGVDTTLSVWSVAMASAISSLTLLVLAPLMLASGGLLTGPAGLGLSAGLGLLIWVGWRLVQRPPALAGITRGALALARHVPVVRHADWATQQPDNAATALAHRVARLRPSHGQWAGLLTVALAGWAVDYAALACCVAATAGFVPWSSVAVGYLAVQASIALQLTPGGTGPAETGLLATLIAGGVAPGLAALAVVAYRAIAWLGLAATGWVVFLYIAEHPRRRTSQGDGR
jgi:uncharacterized membrane protein YbhN (UPF0104 family)